MSREAIKCVPFSAQEHQRVIEFDAPAKDKEKHRAATKKRIKTKVIQKFRLRYGELAKWGPEGFVFPSSMDINFIHHDFQVYPDDLWIITPPKCGTTWMQEIVWMIHTGADVSSAQCNQFYRIPFLELGEITKFRFGHLPKPDFETTEKNEENVIGFIAHSMEYVASLKRPRLIKTHMPLELLPKKLLQTCKAIYVARNVKDMCVSWYYHQCLDGFRGAFPVMADQFKDGLQPFNPYFPHVLGAWKQKDNPNLYFTTYEKMKENLPRVIAEVASFMGKEVTGDQMDAILKYVDIESFRKNKYVNKEKEIPPKNGKQFIRKGQVGDWQNHFTPEMNQQWDPWIAKQLQGSEDFPMVFTSQQN